MVDKMYHNVIGRDRGLHLRGAGSSQPATRAHPAQATLPHLREGWGEVDPEATKLQKSGTRPGKHTKTYGKYWKDPPCSMGKSTISTGPFSIAFCKRLPQGNTIFFIPGL